MECLEYMRMDQLIWNGNLHRNILYWIIKYIDICVIFYISGSRSKWGNAITVDGGRFGK